MISMWDKIWLLRPDEIDLLPAGTVLHTYQSKVLWLVTGKERDTKVTVGIDELSMATSGGYTVYGFENPYDLNHSDEIKRLVPLFILGSK
jgi:hypothetical protein